MVTLEAAEVMSRAHRGKYESIWREQQKRNGRCSVSPSKHEW
jgi:hypothetical protein